MNDGWLIINCFRDGTDRCIALTDVFGNIWIQSYLVTKTEEHTKQIKIHCLTSFWLVKHLIRCVFGWFVYSLFWAV